MLAKVLGVCNNVGEHCLAVQPFQTHHSRSKQVKALQLQVGCASRFATWAVHYALHLMHGVLQVFVGCFDSKLLGTRSGWNGLIGMLRPYHPEYTPSRPIREVKLDWAQLVVFSRLFVVQCACQGLGVCNNSGRTLPCSSAFSNTSF